MNYEYHDEAQTWYSVPKKTGKPYITEPFYDDGGGNFTMCSIVTPVFTKDKEFVGVAGSDMSLENYGKIASQIHVDLPKAGEGYKDRQQQVVLSPQGQLIYYPDAQKLPRKGFAGAFAKDVPEGKAIGKAESGYANLSIKVFLALSIGVTAPNSGWKIAMKIPSSDVFAGMVGIRNQAILSSLIAILAVITCVVILTRRVVKPLDEISRAASALSIGDVSHDIAYESPNELGKIADAFRSVTHYQREMAQTAERVAGGDLSSEVVPKSGQDLLGHSFGKMIRDLRSFIGEVGVSSSTLVSASAQLATSSRNMRESSDAVQASTREVAQSASQTAQTSQMIADDNQKLAVVSDDAYKSVTSLKELIESILSSSDEQKSALEDTAANVSTASTAVTSATNGMQKIRLQVENASGKATQLGDKGNQIGAIVQTIEEISEQTNLLALNAAIEAARAGDAGRGFAVVAEEVRKLAERSQSAAKEIGLLIESVRHDVTDAVDAMQLSRNEVESLSSIAESLTTAVSGVLTSLQVVSEITDQNVAHISRISTAGDQVGSAIQNVSSIGESTSAGAQQMSASAEEVAAAAQEIAASVDEEGNMINGVDRAADQIAQMAKNLDIAVSKFRLQDAKLSVVKGNAA